MAKYGIIEDIQVAMRVGDLQLSGEKIYAA
jgi:hypothetical protein